MKWFSRTIRNKNTMEIVTRRPTTIQEPYYYQMDNGIIIVRQSGRPTRYYFSDDFVPSNGIVVGDLVRIPLGMHDPSTSYDNRVYKVESINNDSTNVRLIYPRYSDEVIVASLDTLEYYGFDGLSEALIDCTPKTGDIVAKMSEDNFVDVKEILETRNQYHYKCSSVNRNDQVYLYSVNNTRLLAKRTLPQILTMAQSITNTQTPRVRCSIDGSTHIVPSHLRDYNAIGSNIILNVCGLTPQVFKRVSHGGYIIDIIEHDRTSPRGSVVKTFYRAWSPRAWEKEKAVEDAMRMAAQELLDSVVETAQTTPPPIPRYVSEAEAQAIDFSQMFQTAPPREAPRPLARFIDDDDEIPDEVSTPQGRQPVAQGSIWEHHKKL